MIFGAVVTGVFYWLDPDAVWWVYLVVFWFTGAAAFQGAVEADGKKYLADQYDESRKPKS